VMSYSVKPTLVAQRLGKKLRVDQKAPLVMTENLQVHYDPDMGIIVTMELPRVVEGIQELRTVLNEARLPLLHENETLLTATTWAFQSGNDVALMESAGFRKTENTWSWCGSPETHPINENTK